MRIWLARESEIPLRCQLVSQIVLSILCGDVKPGERLPSIRELARRLKVHANTVSAAYRELERNAWVEFHHGSGVFVRHRAEDAPLPPGLALDRLIGEFLREARRHGASLAEVRARLQHWLALEPPDRFLVIDPDPEVRRILAAEISRAVTFPVTGCAPADCRRREMLSGAIPLALPSKYEQVRALLPPAQECVPLEIRSVPGSLAAWMPLPPEALLAVASRWPDFLKWARTMLLSAGASPDALELRDARRPRWRDGLREMTVVITDVLTAEALPPECRSIVFRLLSDECLASLRDYVRFLSPARAASSRGRVSP